MSRIDAEAAVVGACLVDQSAYWKVADLLSAEDFANERCRAVWSAIADMRRDGVDADFITVGEKHPKLSDAATHLANSAFAAANVKAYAEWVAQAAIERRVHVAGQRIANLRGADSLADAQQIIASCHRRAVSAVRPIGDFLRQSTERMQRRCDDDGELTGIPTSLEWLDEITSGWQKGDLIVIAARPSVGKTALAMQCAVHAAQANNPVFFASLEQSGEQIADRVLAHLSSVSLQLITQPKRLSNEDWDKLIPAGGTIDKLPVMVDETGALTVDAICARARQVNADRKLSLIVIDYLQQITPPKADKVADAIQVITRSLKALAKQLNVPIILLSQLNRDGDDKPILKNLRDSGAIEQDADIVIMLHRPDSKKRHLVEIIIAKHRNGPIDSTYLESSMSKMRFVVTDERPTKALSKLETEFGRTAP